MTIKSNSTGFYKDNAKQLYTSTDFDYTVKESVEYLPAAKTNELKNAIVRSLATAVFAIAAGIVTIPANVLPFAISATTAITEKTQHPPTISRMTEIMEKRAALADMLFRTVPHPDDDDIEPDYGF
jgi:hypothetical protein